METVKEPGRLKGVDFLRWASLVLNDTSFTEQTDGHKEIESFTKFERLGLKAGETFDPKRLTPAIKAAVEEGIETHQAVMKPEPKISGFIDRLHGMAGIMSQYSLQSFPGPWNAGAAQLYVKGPMVTCYRCLWRSIPINRSALSTSSSFNRLIAASSSDVFRLARYPSIPLPE
jgi:hypothetical protein